MSKFLCMECKTIEVNDLFTICDSCLEEKKNNSEKEIIANAEKLIKQKAFALIGKDTAHELAISTLKFAKEEFEKSIGALILDGVFESENDSGVGMLKLYIRDYEKQIDYITKTYL